MGIFKKIQRVQKLSGGLRNLYMHKVIRDTGIGLVGMFGPIFWYVLTGSFKFVLFYYGLLCLLSVITTPLWARILKYRSMHVWMIIGVFGCTLYFVCMYFISQVGSLTWYLLGALLIFSQFNRQLYWMPYHIDLARFMNKHHRGRQMSFLAIVVSLVGIVLPIFSGFIIGKFGFSVLFILACMGIFVSILPLFFVPNTREEYTFGYFETFRKLFKKRHFKSNLAYTAQGFQGYVGGLVWPVFIFLLFDGNYLEVGFVSAAVVLVSCVLRYIVGEMYEKMNKKKLIGVGSVLYSLGWAFKAMVATSFHVFLAGVYHDVVAIFFRTPFATLFYEIAADEGHYVDEFTILREISLNIGRVLLVIVGMIILHFDGVMWIFRISVLKVKFGILWGK